MSAILALIVKFGPWALGLAGVLFGAWRHKSAQTTEAMAGQAVAEAQKNKAQNDAALAAANQAGAQAGADNAKVRRDEDADAGALPDANRVLHDEWGK